MSRRVGVVIVVSEAFSMSVIAACTALSQTFTAKVVRISDRDTLTVLRNGRGATTTPFTLGVQSRILAA